MRDGRAFTLVELMVVVAIIAVLAAIAIPSFYEMQLAAKRAELGPNVEGIKTAIAAYHAAHDGRLECTQWAPDATPGKTARPFVGVDASCFTGGLGWSPDGDVRGSYELFTYSGFTIESLGTQCGWYGVPEKSVAVGYSDVDAARSAAAFAATDPAEASGTGLCRAPDTY